MKSNEKPSQIKIIEVLFYLVSVVLVAATYYRIYFGVDFSDEAQALGWLYGPFIGFKPFVNDLFMQQSGALLFRPLFYVYHELMENEGIALFARHIFIVLSIGASFCVYLFSKNLVSRPFAILISSTTFSYIPFGFPELYYNNIAYVCLLSALFLWAAALTEKSEKKLLAVGILLGLGVFSYPTLTFATAAFYIASYLYLKSKNINQKPFLANLTLGIFIVCVAGTLLLLSFGIENLKFSIEFSGNFTGFGLLKIITMVVYKYIQWFPDLWKFGFLAAVGFAFHKTRWFCFPWVFVLFPFITQETKSFESFVKSHSLLVFYTTAVAPLLIYFSLRERFHLELAAVFSVSIIGGFSMAWTSGNGLPNAAIGFYPGAIASIIFFSLLIQKNKNLFRLGGERSRLFVFLICLSFGGSIVYSNYTYMYRDDVVTELDTRIKTGPFAGLITTEGRVNFITQIQQDIDDFSKGRESVLFYDHFPAGYLFSELKPMTKSLFMHPGKLRKIYMDFYSHEENLPDIVFEFYAVRESRKRIFIFNLPSEARKRHNFFEFANKELRKGVIFVPLGNQKDAFRHFFFKRSDYEIVRERNLYRILARNKTSGLQL